MTQNIRIKFCGLKEPRHVNAAVAAGAAYLGFNFFEKSPRFVDIDRARDLAAIVPPGVAKVALTVNADNAELDRIVGAVPLDMLQLHGSESPARVTEVKNRYGLPVMKAVGVATAEDLAQLDEYSRVADQILLDAKPPKGADLPGGNGLTFDWQLIAGRRWSVPWMLAGGLTAQNVSDAVKETGARQVDLSSAIETAPGQKSAALIEQFAQVVRGI